MPPVVQNLSDLVNQYTTATQPEFNQIDTSVANNEQSGTAQTQGLDAAKNNAFGGITQNANNRGMYFSGFTPDAEAKYTASTYLPALAKLQSTIAATRNSLLGQKANLNTTINTNALNTQKSEQSALNTYNAAQQAEANAEKRQQESNAFTAQQNALNRQATAASNAARLAAANPAKGFGVSHTTTGGLNFHGPNGQPVTAAQYAQATGGNISDILSASGDPNDKQILNAINKGASYAQLVQKYPYVFGGV